MKVNATYMCIYQCFISTTIKDQGIVHIMAIYSLKVSFTHVCMYVWNFTQV